MPAGRSAKGKLPLTIYPSSFAKEADPATYDMSKAPGRTYKYYTKTPLYPFGFGLSLTNFSMQCVQVGGPHPIALSVECTVTNVGKYDGDEVVLAFHSAGADAPKSNRTRALAPTGACTRVCAGMRARARVRTRMRAHARAHARTRNETRDFCQRGSNKRVLSVV